MDYIDFTRLDIGSSFMADITRADAYKVTITVDKSLTEYLTVEQRGDILHLGLKAGYTYTDAERRAVITLPDLRGLELSGSSEAKVGGFSTSHAVDFQLSAASALDINGVKAGNTGFELSGSSEVRGRVEMDNGSFDLSGASFIDLTGLAKDMSIEASGGSEINLEEFPVDTAAVNLSGGSFAFIDVKSRIDIDLSGGSELTYTGDPKVGSIDVSGGSIVNRE
jgi:hypothetical protein